VRAVDTNIVVRTLLNDDPKQSPIARRVIDEGVFVSPTVMLETAWLLRSRYKFSREAVADYLNGLMELPTVSIDQPDLTAWAIARSAERGDLADLLHIVAARGASAFVTFDDDVLQDAAPDSPVPVVIPR
jgi:predicted nucleic-acid-binding protein